MNKSILIVFLFLGAVSNSFSQKSLSDYSYVVVSEQFEFQKEKDRFELNSLTKFLFNKYGFHAFFDRELPVNVKRCDGLWVDAEAVAGFILTKVQLVISDCNSNEVYRTNYGESKNKDYKEAYYECVREAFEEIKAMGIQQNEIEEVELIGMTINQNSSNELQSKVITTDAPLNIEPVKKETLVVSSALLKSLPKAKYTTYSNSGNAFLLRKTSSGYKLYQELIGAEDDLLLIGKISIEDPNIYFENDNKEKIKASFDKTNNLIVGEGKEEINYKLEN